MIAEPALHLLQQKLKLYNSNKHLNSNPGSNGSGAKRSKRNPNSSSGVNHNLSSRDGASLNNYSKRSSRSNNPGANPNNRSGISHSSLPGDRGNLSSNSGGGCSRHQNNRGLRKTAMVTGMGSTANLLGAFRK